jgi:hypothetical protein
LSAERDLDNEEQKNRVHRNEPWVQKTLSGGATNLGAHASSVPRRPMSSLLARKKHARMRALPGGSQFVRINPHSWVDTFLSPHVPPGRYMSGLEGQASSSAGGLCGAASLSQNGQVSLKAASILSSTASRPGVTGLSSGTEKHSSSPSGIPRGKRFRIRVESRVASMKINRHRNRGVLILRGL